MKKHSLPKKLVCIHSQTKEKRILPLQEALDLDNRVWTIKRPLKSHSSKTWIATSVNPFRFSRVLVSVSTCKQGKKE